MRTFAVVAAVVLTGCVAGQIGGDESDGIGGQGGGGGGGGEDLGEGSGSGSSNAPRVTASLDKPTVATELGKTENLVMTISSTNGFAGTVTVTPAMVGAMNWTVTPTPASVELAADGTATVMLAVRVPTDTAALTPMLKVDLASSAAPTSVASTFTVENQLTINIGSGTGTGAPHAGLPAMNAPIRIVRGAKVIFHNADAIQHVIHADGGINHQNTGQGLPGTDYVTTPTEDATWYCHNHEGGGTARAILVQQ